MGTEVMQPRDLLTATRVPPTPLHRRGNLVGTVNRKGNSGVHRKSSPKSNQAKGGSKAKKPTSIEPRRKNGVGDSGLVMGKVTLLRRGEALGQLTSNIMVGEAESTSLNRKPLVDLEVRDPDLIEPVSPLMVPKKINVQALADEYSGSPFYSSPSPRSVPVPSFFMKQLVHGEIKLFDDDSASRDLRRMLRLD